MFIPCNKSNGPVFVEKTIFKFQSIRKTRIDWLPCFIAVSKQNKKFV